MPYRFSKYFRFSAKRNKLTNCNIKSKIVVTAEHPLPGERTDNQTVSYTQQLVQFEQPLQTFQCDTYPEQENCQMYTMQAANVYSKPHDNRNFPTNPGMVPQQDHIMNRNPHMNYINQETCDGGAYGAIGNYPLASNYPTYMPPTPQPPSSNWRTSNINHPGGNFFRDENNQSEAYMTNGIMVNDYFDALPWNRENARNLNADAESDFRDVINILEGPFNENVDGNLSNSMTKFSLDN